MRNDVQSRLVRYWPQEPLWLRHEKARSFWKGVLSGVYLAAVVFITCLILARI